MDRSLELRIGESLDLAALGADEVVVMLLVAAGGLVPGDTVPDVDALHKPRGQQRLEDAVDAREPDVPAPVLQRLVQRCR